MSSTELGTYPSAWTKKTLTAEHYVVPEETRVKLSLDSPIAPRTAIDLAGTSAIDLAKRILRALEPEALVPLPFSETPVGTYLRNITTGVVVKVRGYDKDFYRDYRYYEDSKEREQYVYAVREDDRPFVAWQNPHEPRWEPVEVETSTQEIWTVTTKK